MAQPAEVPVVAAVAKAALVLAAFRPSVRALSVRQVSERTAIPRSTVHALCHTLTQAGLLEVVAGGYQLGPVLLELGGQVIERSGLVRAAEGVLEHLVGISDAEAHLGQLSQGWVVYVDRQAGARRTPMRNRVGQRAPAHLTGCGKASLAWLPAEEVDDLIRRTCTTAGEPVPDFVALRAELDEVARHGYAVSRTFQHNRTSVAAAVLSPTRRPLGAISVAGPSSVFTTRVLRRAREAVCDGAALISTRLVQPG